MKKSALVCMLVLLFAFLTGCSLTERVDKEEKPDYPALVKQGVNNFFSNGNTDIFIDSSGSVFVEDVAAEYNKYRKHLLKTFSCSGVSISENSQYELTITVPVLEELAAVAVNDTNGFLNDIKNMASLGQTEEEEKKYVYTYLDNILGGVSYKEEEVTVIGEADKSTVRISSEFLQDYQYRFMEELPSQLLNYALNGTPLSLNVDIANAEKTTFSVGKGVLLNYNVGDKCFKLFVTPVEVLQNEDAVKKIKAINGANQNFNPGSNQVRYIEYKVYNLEDEEVTLENPFKFIDSENREYTYTGFNFVGINSTQKIPAGETKVVSAVFIGNGKDMSLGWYDSTSKLFVAVE